MAPRCAALVPRNACKHRIGTHAQRVCRSRLVALLSSNVCHTLCGMSPCARLHAGFYPHAYIYFCMRMPAQASYLRQLLCWRMCWRASSLAAENRIPLGTAGTVASEKNGAALCAARRNKTTARRAARLVSTGAGALIEGCKTNPRALPAGPSRFTVCQSTELVASDVRTFFPQPHDVLPSGMPPCLSGPRADAPLLQQYAVPDLRP